MDKKKILIVTSGFYPENSPRANRATELAKCFSKLGHGVTVLSPRIETVHSKFEKEYGLIIKDLGHVSWKSVLLKGAGLLYWFRRGLRRMLQLLLVYPDIQLMWLTKKALKFEKDYDLLISIAIPYPIHWGVAWAHNSKDLIAETWVADCGDPFMGQENDTFKYPFYFKYVEKWFCRKANFLTVPTEGAVAGYYPEFHDKIKVIPQGFDFDEKFPEPVLINKQPKPTLAYGGVFIPGRRDPREFLSYLISSSIDFEFHIFTPSVDIIKPFAEKDNRIVIHPVISRREFMAELSNMDFLVNFENVGSKQTPSKLIDYLIVDKPILSIKTGDLNPPVIEEFLQGNYSNRLVIEKLDRYNIINIANQFLRIRS